MLPSDDEANVWILTQPSEEIDNFIGYYLFPKTNAACVN